MIDNEEKRNRKIRITAISFGIVALCFYFGFIAVIAMR